MLRIILLFGAKYILIFPQRSSEQKSIDIYEYYAKSAPAIIFAQTNLRAIRNVLK